MLFNASIAILKFCLDDLGYLNALLVKNLPTVQETWVQSLRWEDPLEKGKTTHSSILAWRILLGLEESDMTEQLSLSL